MQVMVKPVITVTKKLVSAAAMCVEQVGVILNSI